MEQVLLTPLIDIASSMRFQLCWYIPWEESMGKRGRPMEEGHLPSVGEHESVRGGSISRAQCRGWKSTGCRGWKNTESTGW